MIPCRPPVTALPSGDHIASEGRVRPHRHRRTAPKGPTMTRREFFDRIRAAFGFGPKHEHVWRTVGYGGAGWYLLRCEQCGREEIA